MDNKAMTVVTTQDSIFNDADVHVSTTRVIIQGTTYPTANITSVRSFMVSPSRLGPVVFLVVGGILLITQAWVWAAILILIGGAWLASVKKTYTLLIGTAGGEHKALSSQKSDYINNIVAAINQAIVSRG
jgi:hypothetical protein